MNGECNQVACNQLRQEFQHLNKHWWWLLLFGILLAACGTIAVILPTVTAALSFATVAVLGVLLVIGGVATIVTAFWAGKWSGMLLQLFIGVIYTAVGFMIIDTPLLKSVEALTLFLAAFFIVVGGFRIIASLLVQFPYWGWSLLNGLVTFMLGVIIYRLYERLPLSSIWILGLLIGIEMLLYGWTWVMLALAVREIPQE